MAASRTLPLADAPALWRHADRTRYVRIGLALALLGVFAALAVTAFGLRTRSTSYFTKRGNGIVLLDLSASVDPRANVRLATFLRTLADSDQRVGLVAFEEQAYELLPPGSRGDGIRPMLRFFGGAQPLFGPETPWSRAFLGGTSIGAGLHLARQIVERKGEGSVLLISDLQDASSDIPLLTDEISRLERERIPFHVLPLFPNEPALALFTGLVGRDAFVDEGALQKNARVAEHQGVVAEFPWWLLLLAAALLLGVATNEYVGRRLEWSEP
jgi:VWA domain containing CoxE-like protein